MLNSINILIGVAVLLIAFPIGSYLAKITREELKSGQRWFKLIILTSALGSALSIIFKNDSLLFTFLFIIIVTSRSLRKK